jgi:hypothetical protein
VAAFLFFDELLSIRPNTTEGWVRAVVPFVFFAVLAIVVWRLVRRPWLRVVIVGVPLVAFLVYAVGPAFVDEKVEERVATGAARQRVGVLTGIDHRATGEAAIYRLADGGKVLRLEKLDMQNGPDLFVYLVPKAGQREPDGGVNLGRLKGNQGNQQYELPARTDPDDYEGVLVWCRQFATAFAGAPLA